MNNDLNSFLKKLSKKNLSEIIINLANKSEIIKTEIDNNIEKILENNVNKTYYENLWKLIINSKPLLIAGPCAVESKEQIELIAENLSKLNVSFLRGGLFKYRTDPKNFQGLGFEGLKYIYDAAKKNNMYVVTEILSESNLDDCFNYIDIIQVGSRNMSNSELLKYIGKNNAEINKPILLKRGMQSTIEEMIKASEYLLNEGNNKIIFCLRGIRTFEQINSIFRFTPDIAGILELREYFKMIEKSFPVIFDPSHSSGNSKYVFDLSKLAINSGFDGLIIEVHDNPENALSDKLQAITTEQLKHILGFMKLKQ